MDFKDILPVPDRSQGFEKLSGREVTFLLGTDRHIGKPGQWEERVAITPEHCKMLSQWLHMLGIKLRMLVVKDAGKCAGFPDDEFEREGATIVEEGKLAGLTPGPDLVHALKEPTNYEADIAPGFIRIGALHSGDFNVNSGLAKMLEKGNYRAIFDGSAVGEFAFNGPYPVKPKFPIPLRSSMSVFAGRLAAEDVGRCLVKDETVVISGGGVVGTSAASLLLERFADRIAKVILIEIMPLRCEQLRKLYGQDTKLEVVEADGVPIDLVRNAKGLIFTLYKPGSAATPRVISVDKLAELARGATIVDVAIDEGGCISIPGIEDSITEITPLMVKEAIESLNCDLNYTADNHMPRRSPHAASIVHGDTALMYLAVLLYLCAKFGGPEGAIVDIQSRKFVENPTNIFEALTLDLKKGLAFSRTGKTTSLHRDVLKKSGVIMKFLSENNIQFH